MKKVIAITLALASTAVLTQTTPALASTTPALANTTSGETEVMAATAFTSLGVFGFAAAGPVGMFVGALGGALIGEQYQKTDRLAAVERIKIETEQQLAAAKLEAVQRSQAQEQAALESLQLQILFASGSDTLTPQSKQHVLSLARFLVEHPHLNIHLTGHADPRGTDEYNDVLSHQRALTIQFALEQVGIENDRVSVSAHGSAYSQAVRGNLDSYAFDRRVDIDVIQSEQHQVAMSR